ncbi:Mini-ribonuclease 3 [Synechococcus sp. CCY 9618]|uniref:Mini-ribonuclease 3 n=1 Tax=Synechococcus sp. CCY 9618 TaxID=2815602 RepID=UPI001C2190EE|nr:ribonuclease III domain-containing protein [Synechococcus sp. CCY 9618]
MASLPTLASEVPLATAQLAWLGDAVWELHQRLRHCQRPARAADLHRAVVAEVQAEAQAEALRRLDPLLSEEERRVMLRGRNQAGRGPRRGAPAAYGQATGFETMLGWLFLQNPRRLAELLDHLEKTEPCPPSTSP